MSSLDSYQEDVKLFCADKTSKNIQIYRLYTVIHPSICPIAVHFVPAEKKNRTNPKDSESLMGGGKDRGGGYMYINS